MKTLTSVDSQALRELRERGEFFWLDLDDPGPEAIDSLGRTLGLHELAVEDTRKFGQRPKAETYGEAMLLVYFGARFDEQGIPVPVEVHLHLSHEFAVTVHHDRCRKFDLVREILRSAPDEEREAVVYRVIDALTDSLLDVLEQVDDELEEFEARVFRRPRARDRDRMATLRQALGSLRRVVLIQREMFGRAVSQIVELPGLGDEFAAYYRDVGDHIARAADELDAARETLQGLLDTYANEVQERLTIVATIFLPLTVLTGFFGQNFTWMIDHIGAAWAFWGLGLGGMLVSVLAIVIWLRHTGLSHRSRR